DPTNGQNAAGKWLAPMNDEPVFRSGILLPTVEVACDDFSDLKIGIAFDRNLMNRAIRNVEFDRRLAINLSQADILAAALPGEHEGRRRTVTPTFNNCQVNLFDVRERDSPGVPRGR